MSYAGILLLQGQTIAFRTQRISIITQALTHHGHTGWRLDIYINLPSRLVSVPVPITPATRLAITTLKGEGLTYEQIAERTGVHRDTVMRTLRRASGQQIKKYEQELATRESILRRMAYIMEKAVEYRDSIAAAKLIATMEGWLSERNIGETSVNINMLSGSVDIKGLEREYQALSAQALESPTTQNNSQVDTTLSPTRSDELVGQPSASEANQEREGDP